MSRCMECLKNGIDHDEVVRECKDDLLKFAIGICGMTKLDTRFHRAMVRWFQNELRSGYKRFLIMIPRGHLKTSLFTVAYPLWRLVNDPDHRFLIVMSNSVIAGEKLGIAQDIVFSFNFRHFFPECVPDKRGTAGVKWNESAMELPRSRNWGEPSIRALGKKTKLTGGHYDEHIFDDLIDLNESDSIAEIESAKKFLRLSPPLFNVRSEGIQIVVGTLWPGGFYEDLMQKKHYRKLILGCYADDRFRKFMDRWDSEFEYEYGDPITPENESKSSLEDMHEEMTTFDFTHQMLNKVADDETKPFRSDDIHYYNISLDRKSLVCSDTQEVALGTLFITLTCDPGSGETATSDHSAITVCGFHRPSSKVFVLYSWSGNVRANDLIDKIIEVAKRYNPRILGIEQVALSSAYRVLLENKCRADGLQFSIRPIKNPPGRSKAKRILDSLQPFCANGQMYFHRKMRNTLVAELLNINMLQGKLVGRSPNLVDSLSMHHRYWMTQFKEEVSDDDDIPFKRPDKPQESKFYGLGCEL